MIPNNLGYNKPLFVLPFDHRSSFIKGLLQKEESQLLSEDRQFVKNQKKLIYQAFQKTIELGIPKEEAAILVDEEYGEEILKDASLHGFNILLTTEKTGQKEYTFQYGEDFGEHIKKHNPLFVKALIRYNPQDSDDSKKRQQQTLKILSDFCQSNSVKLLIEPLIHPTEDQLAQAGGDKEKYIDFQRPFLAAKLIEEIQDSGIEPDVWKLEGTKNRDGYERIVMAAQRNNRDNVNIVVLGGGQSREIVQEWIKTAAEVKGIIGFAVGRTVFWQSLLDLKEGRINKETAINQIADNFLNFYNLFKSKK